MRQAKEPRFKRAPSMAALPVPIAGSGDLDALRAFVNVGTDRDFRLMVSWLLGCLRPSGPYPLLILTGEQGSAKSTTSKVLRALVDPSTLETRSFPGDERGLVIAAQGAHVLVFDNLSRIKPSMADALCRLATGGGFATRKLHSDADEVLVDATRPCILNGIPDLSERADLADRAIALTLPTISERHRHGLDRPSKALLPGPDRRSRRLPAQARRLRRIAPLLRKRRLTVTRFSV
ncbi:hypothetical protein [Rhodovulum marinum]|uniref:ATP-binding protein n=1 Tax=Rhodovulum marinum TaxID=320662 RepID=A0A4R2PV43_9RHOB|nr:hypothetical protein [Rhodovulum marinum]TCP39084.1 hypothetical protein EV662_11410 [Rhodovulum marinum]